MKRFASVLALRDRARHRCGRPGSSRHSSGRPRRARSRGRRVGDNSVPNTPRRPRVAWRRRRAGDRGSRCPRRWTHAGSTGPTPAPAPQRSSCFSLQARRSPSDGSACRPPLIIFTPRPPRRPGRPTQGAHGPPTAHHFFLTRAQRTREAGCPPPRPADRVEAQSGPWSPLWTPHHFLLAVELAAERCRVVVERARSGGRLTRQRDLASTATGVPTGMRR